MQTLNLLIFFLASLFPDYKWEKSYFNKYGDSFLIWYQIKKLNPKVFKKNLYTVSVPMHTMLAKIVTDSRKSYLSSIKKKEINVLRSRSKSNGY